MEAEVVLRKTDKGQEEIATRAHHLGARERSLLILVDGKSTVGQLIAKMAHVPNSAEVLDRLLAGGFVEAPGAAAVPVAAPPPKPVVAAGGGGAAASAAAGAGLTDELLPAVVRYARRFVLDAMGPDGDALAEQIEACRKASELRPVLDRTREVLRMSVGRRKADEFWAAMEKLLAGG